MVYDMTSGFPENERNGLFSQMRRGAVSVPSNIAEGSSRSSELEKRRFLEIALGSAFELETQLLIVGKLKMVREELVPNLNSELTEVQKMICGLKEKLVISS